MNTVFMHTGRETWELVYRVLSHDEPMVDPVDYVGEYVRFNHDNRSVVLIIREINIEYTINRQYIIVADRLFDPMYKLTMADFEKDTNSKLWSFNVDRGITEGCTALNVSTFSTNKIMELIFDE
jgi:hypothetical protein